MVPYFVHIEDKFVIVPPKNYSTDFASIIKRGLIVLYITKLQNIFFVKLQLFINGRKIVV